MEDYFDKLKRYYNSSHFKEWLNLASNKSGPDKRNCNIFHYNEIDSSIRQTRGKEDEKKKDKL